MSENKLHILEGGGRVVVIGAEWERKAFVDYDDPRLVYIDTGSSQAGKRDNIGELPRNARWIFTTQHISHEAAKKVREHAKNVHAVYSPASTIGMIKVKLATMGVLSKKEIADRDRKEAPVPEKSIAVNGVPIGAKQETAKRDYPATTAKRGERLEFVRKHVNLHSDTGSEAKRLLALAQKQGLTTTEDSLRQAIQKMRRDSAEPATASSASATTERPAAGSGPPPAPLAPSSSPVTETSPPASAAPPAAPPAPVGIGTSADFVRDEQRELIRVIDDVIVGLQLIREEIVQATRDRVELAELRAKLKALAGG